MITTTLAEIRAQQPCATGWRTLTTALGSDYGDTTPLLLSRIVDTNGIAEALWALVRVCPDGKRIAVEFASDCAERVLCIWEARYPDDDRPRKAIEAARGGSAEAYAAANVAYAAAYAAANVAYSAYSAATATVYADAAKAAANAAEAYAAANVAYAAAYAAANVAYSAYSAANAAYSAAYAADERAWQKCHLKELLDGAA